jgi:polysaccharide deacetylase 2 family uncharacterized protein YibQ
LRDELNEPLGQAPPRTPLRARLRPLGVWSRRVALVGVALAAAGLYWRATAPRPVEVAVIPFDAITTVTPSPTPAATSPQVSVYPPADAAVSVVRKGVTGGANGHGPEIIEVGEALGRPPAAAVEARLVEPSKYGPLPRIAADGARPSAVYARPFAETPMNRGAPRIAVLVGGVGLDPQTTEAAISRLPAAVSLGLAPYGPELAKVATRARAAGHELWLQAPMEGVGGTDPGPHTLKSDASAAQNEDSLRWLMARFTGYVGIENYLGAKYTADADAVSPTLAEIARRGLLFLDDGSSAMSKVGDLAAGLDLKAGKADVIAVGDAAAIDAALAQAEDIARRGGAAILVASALPSTLDRLAPWAQGLEAKGFAFAPVSALTIARPDRAARANP